MRRWRRYKGGTVYLVVQWLQEEELTMKVYGSLLKASVARLLAEALEM